MAAALDCLARAVARRLAVPVEVSARHVHLSRRDGAALLGPGYRPAPERPLGRPGEYLCRERLTLLGPGGKIGHTALVGPWREKSQVEVSLTGGRRLGLAPPVRPSGDTVGSPGLWLCWGERQLYLPEGVIVPRRHIHMTPADAARFGIAPGETVRLALGGERRAVLAGVRVLVEERGRTAAHLDWDEANACGVGQNAWGVILP